MYALTRDRFASFRNHPHGPALTLAGFAVVCWVVTFWGLGTPTLLDPDEAHYAQITREMYTSGHWLVPTLESAPLIDKPVLFHWLQGLAFWMFGFTGFAARLITAISAVCLLAVTWLLGTRLFDRDTGLRGALMLATTTAFFALSRVAVFDMIFTTLLFGGVTLLLVAAFDNRRHLEWPGYVLIALAVQTKGPVAVVLIALTFFIALIGRDTRTRLLQLRWVKGVFLMAALSVPWFAWMWYEFGAAFVDQYIFYNNLSLFGQPLYRRRFYPFFYVRTYLLGFLPWSVISLGRLADLVRHRFRDVGPREAMLWIWVAVVVGFFSASRFKLDTYIFPAAPAVCLLASRAWAAAQEEAPSIKPTFTQASLMIVAIALAGASVLTSMTLFNLNLDLPPGALVIPVALCAGAIAFGMRLLLRRFHPPRFPYVLVTTMLVVYATVPAMGFRVLERTRPTPAIARWLEGQQDPYRLAVFRLGKWQASLRYYSGQRVKLLEEPAELKEFFERPGREYCVVTEEEFNRLIESGIPLTIAHEVPGVVGTEGRTFRRQRWGRVIVATMAQP